MGYSIRHNAAAAALVRSLVAVAAALPLLGMDPAAWRLGENTLRFVLLVCVASVPLGTLLAVLLFRCNVPGRRLALWLLVMQLFIPLHVQAAAWNAGFGVSGWFTSSLPGTDRRVLLELWRGAVWVQAVALLPWVTLIVGAGLKLVEPELEEEALQVARPSRVIALVTLPRAAPAIGVAVLWVAMSAAGDMTVTDIYRIRTFAEELYLALAGWAEPGEAALAVAPLLTLVVWLLLLVVPAVSSLAPAAGPIRFRREVRFNLGRARWLWVILICALLAVTLAVPVGNLIYQAGMQVTMTPRGAQRSWSAAQAWQMVVSSPGRYADEFRWSGQIAACGACLATAVGAALAAWARGSVWGRGCTLYTAALAAAVPGPLLAMGLIALVNHPEVPLLVFVYDRTIIPAVLAVTVKSLPVAALVLWAAMRRVPQDLLDAAALDGARCYARFWHVLLPEARPALAAAWLLSFAVGVGELGATVLLLPPGVETLSRQILGLVHSGVEDFVAGICLTVLALIATLTLAGSWLAGRTFARDAA
jgi:iron(III) transport system permease protein